MLILITGVPGSGKTSVAEHLCKKIGAKEIDLKELALKGKFLEGYDEKRGSLIINEKRISGAVKKHMTKKGNYVISSHLAHFVEPKLVKLCVVLRCKPEVLEKRLKNRGYHKNKIAENMMCEYLDYILIEALKLGHKKHIHEIDTTHKSADSVANEIISVLEGNKKKSFGHVSWLH